MVKLWCVLKKIFRRFFYPILNHIHHLSVQNLTCNWPLDIDLYSIGQRGNDYPRHRRKVNSFRKIKGSKILIAGCGSGKDILSWVNFSPDEIIGVDLFSYPEDWEKIKKKIKKNNPDIKINFIVNDLENLSKLPDNYFDIVSSDAVFEHVKNLSVVLKQLKKKLKHKGILYSGFGPLWYSYGGDHVSGYDKKENGYAHLTMNKKKYTNYLKKLGAYEHDENDGRTWIKNDLFSYLKPNQYLDLLENAGFLKLYNRALINEHALDMFKKGKLSELTRHYNVHDLLIFGIIVFYQKK